MVISMSPIYRKYIDSVISSYSQHGRSVLIPAQHRILSADRPGFINVCPALQKFLVTHDPCQLARDGLVDVFHDRKIHGEDDIEVTLLYLCIYQHEFSIR